MLTLSKTLITALAVAATFGLTGQSAQAATKPAAKAKAKPAPAPVVHPLTEEQLAEATRVITGDAACEFNQKVTVNAVPGQPGHFKVLFKKAVYNMVPELTTTGAVRLEDKKAGVVWVQIPIKSMLLNDRIGQRLIDMCQQPEQLAAARASEEAGRNATAAASAAQAASAAEAAASAAGAKR
jgi:hypothetical protein